MLFVSAVFLIAQITGLHADKNPYTTGGVPAVDKKWRGKEYATAFQVINTGKVQLPTLRDEMGKQVIERMTNTGNFVYYTNKAVPVSERFNDYMQLQNSVNSILKVYVARGAEGEMLHEETIKILAFSLRVSAVGINLVEEYLPLIPKDERYKRRIKGYKLMKDGSTRSFVELSTSLDEKEFYADHDSAKLVLTAMQDTLPTFSKWFTKKSKSKLLSRLSSSEGDFDEMNARLIKNMIIMLQAEQGATPSP